MKENCFWVVKSTDKNIDKWLLFNSHPWKCTWRSSLYRDYYDDKVWTATHTMHYLGDNAVEKFKDVDHNTEPVKVRLVITQDKNPDLYMQRYHECLFLANHLEHYWHAVKEENKFKKIFRKYKWVENSRVPHVRMISNKLFPEVTEETGVVKINIERI